PEPLHDRAELIGAIRVEDGDVLADDLFRRIAIHRDCATVPRADDAVEVLADDRVVGALHDRGERDGARREAIPERPADLAEDRDEAAAILGLLERRRARVDAHGVPVLAPKVELPAPIAFGEEPAELLRREV